MTEVVRLGKRREKRRLVSVSPLQSAASGRTIRYTSPRNVSRTAIQRVARLVPMHRKSVQKRMEWAVFAISGSQNEPLCQAYNRVTSSATEWKRAHCEASPDRAHFSLQTKESPTKERIADSAASGNGTHVSKNAHIAYILSVSHLSSFRPTEGLRTAGRGILSTDSFAVNG